MHILITGAGSLALAAAEKFVKEDHNIVLIDNDPQKVEYVSNLIDCQTILGSASSLQTLREAGIEKADMLLALTNDDHVNIITGLIAKEYNIPVKIAKISEREFYDPNHILQLRTKGIFDLMISPEKAAADEITRLFEAPLASDYCFIANNRGAIVATLIESDHPFVGKKLSQLQNDGIGTHLMIVAIDRGNDTLIATNDLEIFEGDTIYVTGARPMVRHFASLKSKKERKQIIIVGGNRLGFHVAKALETILPVKIIDPDRKRCEELAEKLTKAVVLNGSGTDTSLLKEEKIEHCQAIISLLNDEERNILVGLVGKSLGAEKALCLTQKQQYSKLVSKLGIDATINPRSAAIAEITRFVRKGQVAQVVSFKSNNCEAIEFIVTKDAKITESPISELELPKNVLIGGLVRGGTYKIPTGTTQIMSGDHVIIFTMPENIVSIEKYFSNEI
ncbi:MAG: Trk system potassium transporter TrkA [Candidatus Cloacimonadota bacterium]|nr:MAG: Trk system potassium transporter TrkA [Candidatus Cloacimonadota bacterium]